MRIAVIGQGNIGGTLAAAFAKAGHEVTIGSRHPEQGSAIAEAPVGAAVAGADVIVLAIPAAAVGAFLADHADGIGGKLVVDTTNRVGAPDANAKAAILAAAPATHYARAFNTLGWENFADPLFDGVPADLFFSSPETDRPRMEELISAVGLRPVYLGADQEAVVDGVLPLWFTLMRLRGNRNLAFRVLER